MKRIPRFDALYEEHLGYLDFFGMIGIYKNPKTIKRFKSWCRGVSDKNGNFYLADDGMTIIHSDIFLWIQKNTNLIRQSLDVNKNTEQLLDDFIMWQRYQDTNLFTFSSTYNFIDSDFPDERWAQRAEKKNPKLEFFNGTELQYRQTLTYTKK